MSALDCFLIFGPFIALVLAMAGLEAIRIYIEEH